MCTRSFRWPLAPLVVCILLSATALAQQPVQQPGSQASQPLSKPSVIFKIQAQNERLDMTVNTSRILTMDQKIPQAQVNNPDLLELTPLSPTQVQVSAKKAGVTQINLWGEDQKLYTIDVIVYGDARELQMILRSTFPNATLKVVPVANAIMISGFVDQSEHVDRIIRIAEEYYPKVINNMSVGGVQQVLLHVKVMEVSRTKLRQCGMDWAKITGTNMIVSGPTSLLSDYNPGAAGSLPSAFRLSSPSTFAFSIGNSTNALFYGVLEALRQDNLLKIMSEPTLVTISGRAASFNSGGEIPVPEPQSLGTISISWKKYGTQIDFVPIVLGNGKIRLEVRPRISELDPTNSYNIGGTTVPGLKSREADTGVELMAGETLAIAGLVQTRTEAQNRGLPWISELPYLGAAFRNVSETKNEVELLIMVTPELVEGMAADEVPQCGPGMYTTDPSDWELFMKGHLEVPRCCPPDKNCGNGDCPNRGEGGDGPPPDGMISNPGEKISTPQPMGATGRSTQPVRGGSEKFAKRTTGANNRYNPSKTTDSAAESATGSQNGPPGFIGPVGYDVVK